MKHKRNKTTPKRALLGKKFRYEDDAHPLHAYLDGLGEESARVMGSALGSIADILSNGKVTAEDLAWHQIRPQHASALRGRLQKLYAPATANRSIS